MPKRAPAKPARPDPARLIGICELLAADAGIDPALALRFVNALDLYDHSDYPAFSAALERLSSRLSDAPPVYEIAAK